jgi:hypothetical protein
MCIVLAFSIKLLTAEKNAFVEFVKSPKGPSTAFMWSTLFFNEIYVINLKPSFSISDNDLY